MVVFLMRHYIRLLALPIAVTIIAGGIFLYKSYTDVLLRNDAVSRKGFSEHVMSMTNFTTDDSNVERLNRWQCAMQMYRERPVLGFGPGSYAFEYGKYQRGANMTKISTNHGDNGTAHNEFFLAISETGLPGLIITILLFFVPIIMGMRGYIRATEHNIRLIYLGATFGLVSYLLLAGVNNFLDQDKVAIAFFGTLAIITALDIRSYRVASHGT